MVHYNYTNLYTPTAGVTTDLVPRGYGPPGPKPLADSVPPPLIWADVTVNSKAKGHRCTSSQRRFKCPGVRPIGVAEVVRRIIGKTILSVIGSDIKQASGSIQLCAGQEAGSEAAIHAIQKAYNKDDAEGVLLIDASNAFNQLNRGVALCNIQELCLSFATILINTYRDNAQLFVDGETLLS